MSNVIDITTLIAKLKALDEQENPVLILFLLAVKEYSALLLSDQDKYTKLIKSFSITEKMNQAFLNVYFLFRSTNPTEAEKRICEATERLRLCTDKYCSLLLDDMGEEELKEKIESYESKIIELVEEYKKAMKAVIRSEMIDESRKDNL